ncbi:hypothetical protein CQW39_14455 [Streptomyces griseofuscus]|uniref:DUF2264 domain-containing protein n=1 Tax=Streptomyces griseofuscus TaxID=146922 RepID=UPI000F64A982|nr:DUF2264 domain-containing protein [Streptomyces griseofuscus]RRQ78248.1 hypothetical protein CQW39_14455 [Streptomyces griseofuscus]
MTRNRPHPFSGNPLHSRTDWQRALLDLCAPLAGAYPDDTALAAPGTAYEPRVARLEATVRPLWGLAPFAAGGGRYDGWERIRRAVAAGTDPEHPGYWGEPGAMDQRLVEASVLGCTLALAPGELWEPLAEEERRRLAGWLRRAARAERVPDNNWHLFPVMVELGLTAVGEPPEPGRTERALARVEDFYRGGGWYSDGPEGKPCDYYGPWALHLYSLLYTTLAPDADPAVVARVRERAALFAGEFRHWFAADGAALPLGRSLTYRFAQCAFWGALAHAGVEALPWGVLRGLWARNLRWWARRPMFAADGTLSVGYAYPNLFMSEQYNAAGSPYWAFKAFLPLALPAGHPFWTAEEEPLPATDPVRPQPQAGLLVQHGGGHTTALAACDADTWVRNAPGKYGRFAYSTAFGCSVSTGPLGAAAAAPDSALLLSEDGLYWRSRIACASRSVTADRVRARWHPWPDVTVDTWLLPAGPGRHVRVHRLVTPRPLHTVEGGFAVPLEGSVTRAQGRGARAECGELASGVADLIGTRTGEIMLPDPNSHLLWPRTALPVLRGRLPPGENWLATDVLATADGSTPGTEPPDWRALPGLPRALPALPRALREALPEPEGPTG